jgi:hypothetical protein
MITSSPLDFLPTPTNHGDTNAEPPPSLLTLFPSSHVCALFKHNFSQFWVFAPLASCTGMKYIFKIETEPTLHMTVVISVVVISSGALTMITVSLDSPSVAVYCITIFALIIWIALTKTKPQWLP